MDALLEQGSSASCYDQEIVVVNVEYVRHLV